MRALTANRLDDGEAVFWKDGRWVDRFVDAQLFADKDPAETAEAQAKSEQTVVVDLEFSADIRKAALTDSIDDTLNYKGVAKRVLAFIEGSSFHLVETLAEHVAMLILEEFAVDWVPLIVTPPAARFTVELLLLLLSAKLRVPPLIVVAPV